MSNVDDNDPTIMGGIRATVKDEGFTEGSEAFDRRKRQLQIVKCRELHGVTSCVECIYHEDCPLYIQVKLDHYQVTGGKPNG